MSGERILIVEDEPVDAHGLEYRLTTEGFQVDLVETGKAALEFMNLASVFRREFSASKS